MPLLDVRDVWLDIDNKMILQGLTLKLKDNETFCLLGANGTGKSTLAYVLMGARGYKPCRGKILLDGKDITSASLTEKAKAGITLAWQEPVRFEGLTVREYLRVSDSAASESTLGDILTAVGLEPERYLDRMVDKSLSGGERKRVELAAVALAKPKVAILDEPDSGIDLLSIDEIAQIIQEMEARGSSILLITHREEMAHIADRAAILCCGQILLEGPAKEISDKFKSGCVTCPHVNYPTVNCVTDDD
ncbi:MAG: ATP-binding cassette domain-containing protein [Asgard group archaeon]|nr:ATP-binding cassette domain-containing protein [Asgard group archaeon]